MRQRGSTLLEVLVAVTLLTLVFLVVSQDMLAAVGAQSEAGANSVAVSEANYLLSQIQGDSSFFQQGTNWTGYTPTGPNGCTYPAMNGSYTQPIPGSSDPNAWQVLPAGCGGSDNLKFMWAANEVNNDTNAADVAIWVKTNQGVYELHGMRKNDPSALTLATAPPISPLPTATPSPTATPTVKPSAPPTPTPSPTPKPSPTVKPSPTPTPPPTPTPSPTIGV